jgi:putative acetyltransferase
MFRIERATAQQMIEVAKVFKSSRRDALPYLPELHSEEEDAHYFGQIVFSSMDVFVALSVRGEKIVGFIAFTREWVNHLYLLPEAQRAGLGGRLLAIAKEGARSLDLWAFQRNQAAQSFYAKHGFKVVEKTDGSGNEEREPDVLLRWTKA